MMNRKANTFFMSVALISIVLIVNSYSIVFADEDFCYDQAGDGHFCFHQRDTCKHQEGHDNIAETPCYNKDRAT